ncbi:hypothetical protein JL720_2459 [Aureococcus anophagefferens]|nr:hypothetical protein JL720_2459 [Aureococcus anophagefferens]
MADDEEDDAHHAHRSGWHNLYRVDQRVPMRFDRPMPAPAPPPPKKKPPPPPRKRDDDYAEFMQFTGVTDPDVAKRHPVDSAFVRALVALGFDRDLALRAEASGMDPEAAKAWCAPWDLVAMGFDVDLACRAASLCRDVESAAEWCLEQQRAPPASRPPPPPLVLPPKPAPALVDADFALFAAPPPPQRPQYAPPPPRRAAPPPPASMPMGGEAPAAVVEATNPYGHAGAGRPTSRRGLPPDDDVLRGGRSLAGVAASGERDQLCLLAAEDDGDRAAGSATCCGPRAGRA